MSADNPLGIDQKVWEAAVRCATSAPRIRRGDQVAIRLKHLFPDFADQLRAIRAEEAEQAARAEQAAQDPAA